VSEPPIPGDPSRTTGPAGADPLGGPLEQARITGLTRGVAARLAAKGIRTLRDLVELAPRRYLDLSSTKKIRDLKIGEEATVIGQVRSVNGRYLRGRKHMLTVRVSDGTGYVDVVWWNQPFRAKQVSLGSVVAVAGRFEKKMGRLQAAGNFFVEPIRSGEGGVHTGRIIPIHPATEGVSPTMLRRFVHSSLTLLGDRIGDPVPSDVARRLELSPRGRALRDIHFPETRSAAARARRRLAFEELFVLSSGLAVRKRRIERETKGVAHPVGDAEVGRFLASLPFEPTAAQRRAIAEITADMVAARPMNRLLQGEVGSGKTVVGLAAAIRAAASGSQTAFMAPTEVLAEQHFLTVCALLEPLGALAPEPAGRPGEQLSLTTGGLTVELLTGATLGKERVRALDAVRTGGAHLLIGTHALIQEGVEFSRLGLAIVDEQHRFGVHQRVALKAKAGEDQPDVLIMTATPIPRTLAMTLYGDLDVSVLDEMPGGRKPIRTQVIGPAQRQRAYDLIRREVGAGRQAFVICPLVEESQTLEAKAAESEFERIRAEVFPDLSVGLIHGRMRPADKERMMRAMRAGEIGVLVATTVVEVGVDIPNATVMLIEDADRFGLSQLHQLRGRIGRGRHPSTCVLATSLDLAGDEEREAAKRRLAAMRSTGDGFRLAELDLEIRGEGQIFGRGKLDPERGEGAPAQAGASDLRFASLLRDVDLLSDARREAFALVEGDPHLESPEHRMLLAEVRRRFADRLDWLFAG
jgi:ATP-dependent DNA helicase RecG